MRLRSSGISIRQLLSAVRDAPAERRVTIVRALTPFLFKPGPKRATAEICEFHSIDDYSSSYARLATLLGRPEQIPAPREIEFLRGIHNREIHYQGAIGSQEYLFLTALASILAPRRALEIGTSSGFSSAVIAAALHYRHPEIVTGLVDTIDLHPRYLVDQSKRVGFEIPDLVPQLAGAVRVHTPRESDFARELLQRDELAFAFIDADHQHPWPLLDSLRIAPYVRNGGWLVFHDIQLGAMGVNAERKGKPLPYGAPFGAEWLFNGWPFRKISGGTIGAVQLPADKLALVPMTLKLAAMGFEMHPASHRRMRKALYRSLADLIDACAGRANCRGGC